jgi:hypothetical protein
MDNNEHEVEGLSFFDAINEGDEDICRSLWLGVILQALLDAKGKYGNTVTQAHARVWLEGRDDLKSEFAAVCSLAGVDFHRTRARCTDILQQEGQNIDFRAMKKDKEQNRTAANRKKYFRRAEKNHLLRSQLAESSKRVLAANDNSPRAANDNQPIADLTQSNREQANDQ